jgi:hypothetical protein
MLNGTPKENEVIAKLKDRIEELEEKLDNIRCQL